MENSQKYKNKNKKSLFPASYVYFGIISYMPLYSIDEASMTTIYYSEKSKVSYPKKIKNTISFIIFFKNITGWSDMIVSIFKPSI